MKKLIAMLLCVALVAALSVSAFATVEVTTASEVEPATVASGTSPKSVADAVTDKGLQTESKTIASNASVMVSALKDAQKLVDNYEKVIKNPSSSAADVTAAKADFTTEMGKLVTAWGNVNITLSDGTATTLAAAKEKIGPAGSEIEIDMSKFTAAYDPDTVAAADSIATGIVKASKVQAAASLAATGYANAVTWDMSNGDLMNATAYTIANAGTDYAAAKADAVKAAAAAKSAAAAAQANAKTLINAAISVAQDAAAIQVANAQTTAYNNLAAAYATAVSDFWADVADAIADMG